METITGWKATLGIHWSSELINVPLPQADPGIIALEPFLFQGGGSNTNQGCYNIHV
jgi:hypothetical protein